MNERPPAAFPPLASFPPPVGLSLVGAEDAGMCVDGVCHVPEEAADSEVAEGRQ